MPVSAAIIELEPLVLSPSEAAAFLSVSERSPSRLISEGSIEARKRGTRHTGRRCFAGNRPAEED